MVIETEESTPVRPLTKKEKRVLQFIELYMQQNDIAPSFTEIKNHFGFASYNSVQSYLKQLQNKGYIHIPGGNQKRAITILKSSDALQAFMSQGSAPTDPGATVTSNPSPFNSSRREASPIKDPRSSESLSVPLLGRVAAGAPIEALDYDEFVDVPVSLVRNSEKTFALTVEGESMIEDGIFDGDTLLIQQQEHATDGEIIVATVENEATVKRFYLHKKHNKPNQFIHNNPQTYTHSPEGFPKVELRPANSSMQSMWYQPDQVDIRGVVVGLIRKF